MGRACPVPESTRTVAIRDRRHVGKPGDRKGRPYGTNDGTRIVGDGLVPSRSQRARRGPTAAGRTNPGDRKGRPYETVRSCPSTPAFGERGQSGFTSSGSFRTDASTEPGCKLRFVQRTSRHAFHDPNRVGRVEDQTVGVVGKEQPRHNPCRALVAIGEAVVFRQSERVGNDTPLSVHRSHCGIVARLKGGA